MIFLGDFLRECWYAGAVRHITEKFELQFHYIIIATSSTQQNWSCLVWNNNNDGSESLHTTMKWTHLLVTMPEAIQILLLACSLVSTRTNIIFESTILFTTHTAHTYLSNDRTDIQTIHFHSLWHELCAFFFYLSFIRCSTIQLQRFCNFVIIVSAVR